MCSEMSQYMPSTATISEAPTIASGSDAQPGMPVTRSEEAAARLTNEIRPERWPITTSRAIAVTTVAIAVARITSPIAAPPAGLDWLPLTCADAAAGSASTATTGSALSVHLDILRCTRVASQGIYRQ